MLFTDTITVYNHYTDATGDHWQKSVVKGVQWRNQKKTTKLSSGLMSQETVVSITIPCSEIVSPVYCTPKQFATMHSSNYFTLDDRGLDVVVLGEPSLEITEERDLKQIRGLEMPSAIVKEVADNRNRTYLPNLKVVAK